MNPLPRPTIAAFVITRNEAAKIGECLASLHWVDEIVVVDDYSSDATPEICREHGVSFHQHRFTGFKDQKRHAMNLTSHEWVLELDADERVSAAMKTAIQQLVNDDFAAYSCFEFKRKTRFWGKWIMHASLYPDYKGRLYNKNNGDWSEGNIHERFITRGVTKKLAGDILHPQDLDLHTYFSRTARYADLSAQDYFSRGKNTSWHHVTIRPLYTFIYRYLLRCGVLDGVQGFVVSVMGAIGTFMKYMKLYELRHAQAKFKDDHE